MYRIVLTALALFPGEEAPFGFAGMELYKTHGDSLGLLVGDLNGDGRKDFAVANNAKAKIEIFLQKSPERMAEDAAKPARYDKVNELHDDARFEKELVPHESHIHALVTGDFDGDGSLELAYRGDPPKLVVLKRKGDRWEKSQDFSIKESAGAVESLLSEDLNGDGRTDLGLLSKEGVSLYLQNAQGRLEPPTLYPTGLDQPTSLYFLRPRQGPPALVLFRAGVQNGVALRQVLGGSLGPEWIFNTGNLRAILPPVQEPKPALLLVSGVSGRLGHYVLQSRADPEAILETPPYLYPLPQEKGNESRSLAWGDVDGDGLLDLVVSNPASSTLEVHLQGKDGLFQPPIRSSTFAESAHLKVGRFHGSGPAQVLLVSTEERIVGLATWQEGRLSFPEPIAGLGGKPLAALAAPLLREDRFDLAAVTEESGEYRLQILAFPEFSKASAVSVPLKFLAEKPHRLLALDIDGDRDRDLVVIPASDPFGVVLNEGEGRFTPLGSDEIGGKWLLSGAKASSYGSALLPDGREALLVAKKNIGRAVALDAERKLAVLEQYPGGEEVSWIALARRGDLLFVLDEKTSTLSVLRSEKGEWKGRQEIRLAQGKVERMELGALGPQGEPALLLAGPSGLQVLRPGNLQRSLEPDWSYETDSKEPWLWTMAEGDFNADSRKDLAVIDWKNRNLEILGLPAAEGQAPSRAFQFEMYEEKTIVRRVSGSGGVRAVLSGDLTGDRKDDLLFLIHDRILLYPQE